MGYKAKSQIAEARRHQVLDLVIAGATEHQIAKQVEVSQAQVNRDIHTRLGELAKFDVEAATQHRALQELRYNRMLLGIWTQAINGDHEAIDRAVKILSRIDAIWGLVQDKPLIDARTQIVVQGEDPTIVMDRILASMAERQGIIEGVGGVNGNSDGNVVPLPPATNGGSPEAGEAEGS